MEWCVWHRAFDGLIVRREPLSATVEIRVLYSPKDDRNGSTLCELRVGTVVCTPEHRPGGERERERERKLPVAVSLCVTSN